LFLVLSSISTINSVLRNKFQMIRDINGALDLAHGYTSGGSSPRIKSVEAAQALLNASMLVLSLTDIIEKEAREVETSR
jgi:hypothetical protein